MDADIAGRSTDVLRPSDHLDVAVRQQLDRLVDRALVHRDYRHRPCLEPIQDRLKTLPAVVRQQRDADPTGEVRHGGQVTSARREPVVAPRLSMNCLKSLFEASS